VVKAYQVALLPLNALLSVPTYVQIQNLSTTDS
jgi:hypothetical protein